MPLVVFCSGQQQAKRFDYYWESMDPLPTGRLSIASHATMRLKVSALLALLIICSPALNDLHTPFVQAAVTGLVTHLKFDNNTIDSAGTGDFTLRGSASYSAQVAPVTGSTASLYLDGGIESQALGGATLFDAWAGGTVSFWMKLNATTTQSWANNTSHDLIYKYDILQTRVFKDASAQLRLMTTHSNGSAFGTWVTSTSALPVDAWIHVATTHTGSTASIYFNGQPVGSGPTGRTLGAASADVFELSTYDGRFSGFIDDLQIYNRAITQAEVLELAGGTGTTPPTTFTLTSSAGAGGTISPLGAVNVPTGTNYSFAISPSTGYRVADVLVDGLSQGAILGYTFTNVVANHTIAATFAPTTATSYTIVSTVTSQGGTITPSGSVTVGAGGQQTFGISANSGYRIADVVVNGGSVGAVASYTFFNVQANQTIAAAFATTPLPTGTFQANYQFITGLSSPTAMSFAPDGRLFITQQAGAVRIVTAAGQLLPAPFLTLSNVRSDDERGLLGIAFDPDFATNQFIYLFYAPGAVSRLSRVTANGNVVVPDSEVVLLEYSNFAGHHYGGDIHFGRDGKLYLGLGDAGESLNSQSVTTFNGKMLRLNKDGTIPSDNPATFTSTSGAVLTPVGQYRAIWAIGLRNPYRFSFQAGTGKMHINDVGAGLWEEVNVGQAGRNYGWPTCEGLCSNTYATNPIYVHERGIEGCAITGGTFYDGTQFPAEYQNDYFIIDYCSSWLRHLRPDNSQATFPLPVLEFSVDLKVSPDGRLYVLGHGAGVISTITFVSDGTNRDPVALAMGTPSAGATPLTVTFDGSTSNDPDGDPLTYSWDFGDGATGVGVTTSHIYTTGGTYNARLTVSDGKGGSAGATVTVRAGSPPTPRIVSPSEGWQYTAGDTITYSGDATDPDDGVLPASAFSWTVLFHHDIHTHPQSGPITGVSGGSFTIPTAGHTEENVFYRIYLTVTDSSGLQTQVTRDVTPRKARVTITSNIADTQVLLDGQPQLTPYAFVGVTGVQRTLGVTTPQTINGQSYAFSGWSNGGSSSQTISTPGTDTTYTVQMVAQTAPVVPLPFVHWKFDNNAVEGIKGVATSARGKITYRTDVPFALANPASVAFVGAVGTYVVADGAQVFNGWSAATTSVWVKIASTTASAWAMNSYHALLYKYGVLQTRIVKTSTGLKLTAAHSNGTPFQTHLVSTRPIATDRWVHLATVHQGTTVTLYIDGQVAGTGSTGKSLGAASTDNLDIIGHGGNYTGLLDDLRIYNRALTEAEIQQLPLQ